jgi:NitT/TauT family transport system substrate-binding protein
MSANGRAAGIPFGVSATSHWPNYLPEYIAVEHGYFAEEGLDFRRWAPDPWTGVFDDMDAGRADAVLGGIWVPAMYHGRGRDYRAFACLNARNPKAFVTREAAPEVAAKDYDWAALVGKTVLAPGAGSAAYYLHTAGLLRRAGVDPDRVHFVRDLSTGILTELFLAGMGDVLITDVVNATVLARSGRGNIALRVDAVGPMPNSVYYTTPEMLRDPDQRPLRFCRALVRAMRWIGEHPARDVASLLRREWPALDTEMLIDVVDDLRGTGLWDGVRIDQDSYDEWIGMLAAPGGLIDAPIDYADLVDPRPADAAATAFPTRTSTATPSH